MPAESGNTGEMTHILLTNDDGYEAPGLKTLAEALDDFATVSIGAPNGEKSGEGQSLALRQPVVGHPKGGRDWAGDGAPAAEGVGGAALLVAGRRALGLCG